MSKHTRPNYPDILGQITDQQRLHFGVVEAALALRPSTPRSGEIFEIIVLLQNTADNHVQVVATPRLPAQDANGRTGRFAIQRDNMTVTLVPGEVGYLSLPLLTAPNTAPGSSYRIGVDLAVGCSGRPSLIRHTDEPADPDYHSFITAETHAEIDALKKLRFSAQKSGRLHKDIEISFGLLSGTRSKAPAQVKPTWYRLWTLADNTDLRLLMERHQTEFTDHILPRLIPENLYDPLFEAIGRRFAGHGYPLQPDEAHYITKLLLHVLDLARQPSQSLNYRGQDMYEIGDMLEHRLLQGGPMPLPGWCRAMLIRLDEDSRIAEHPIKALTTLFFDDLLQDAILHGFELVHQVIRHKLGDHDDAVAYGQRFVRMLHDENAQFTFEDVYLPLVLGGIIVDSHVVLANEKPGYRLYDIAEHIQQHRPPGGPETQRILIYSVCRKVCVTSLEQFSSWA